MKPIYAYFLLLDPDRVEAHAAAAEAAGIVGARPNTWQLCLGALRMWHRILFRSETIGTSSGPPRRRTAAAWLLEKRAIRLPFLLAARAVAPWDLTGLFSSPERITRHLLAAHHDRNQFVFDLQLLAAHPGRLEALVAQVEEIVANESRRARWFRDLVVYTGYHESLLEAARAAAAGDFRLSEAEENDPDLSLTGLLRWCEGAPKTPAETIAAWRAGTFALGPQQALQTQEAA